MNKKELAILRQGLLYCWDNKMINDSKEFMKIYTKLLLIESNMEEKLKCLKNSLPNN